jgi:hypothetical protein
VFRAFAFGIHRKCTSPALHCILVPVCTAHCTLRSTRDQSHTASDQSSCHSASHYLSYCACACTCISQCDISPIPFRHIPIISPPILLNPTVPRYYLLHSSAFPLPHFWFGVRTGPKREKPHPIPSHSLRSSERVENLWPPTRQEKNVKPPGPRNGQLWSK